MRCVNAQCTCRTVDGGYCSDECSAAVHTASGGESCYCNHQGCV